LEWKVKRLMKERGDYKGWYYVPYNQERIYDSYAEAEKVRNEGTE